MEENSSGNNDSGDNSGDSDEKNEGIVIEVFKRFSTHGIMSRKQFNNVVTSLYQYVQELKSKHENTREENIDAVYYLFRNSNGMDKECFKSWWSHPDKFLYFGKKSRNLIKAYKLYRKYSTLNKNSDVNFHGASIKVDDRTMDIKEFTKLLEDLGLTERDDEIQEEEFDLVDADGDGILSFKEFCDWLKWF